MQCARDIACIHKLLYTLNFIYSKLLNSIDATNSRLTCTCTVCTCILDSSSGHSQLFNVVQEEWKGLAGTMYLTLCSIT